VSPYNLKKVGFIAGTHGYKGHLRVKLDSENLNNKEYLFILIEEKGVPFFIEEHSGSDIVKLKFINSLEEGQEYIGHEIAIVSSSEDTPPENTLIGFSIQIENQNKTLKINSIDEFPQGKMWNCSFNETEVLIPEVEEWIHSIDWDLKIIHLDLPEGLLEL